MKFIKNNVYLIEQYPGDPDIVFEFLGKVKKSNGIFYKLRPIEWDFDALEDLEEDDADIMAYINGIIYLEESTFWDELIQDGDGVYDVTYKYSRNKQVNEDLDDATYNRIEKELKQAWQKIQDAWAILSNLEEVEDLSDDVRDAIEQAEEHTHIAMDCVDFAEMHLDVVIRNYK